MKFIAIAGIGLALSLSCLSVAGTVTVQKSSENKPDPWQLKQQILAENAWREQLKYQQGLQWLYQLPLGCIAGVVRPLYYQCGGNFYRPYQSNGQQLYIQIDPPESTHKNIPADNSSKNSSKGQNKP